MCVRGLCRLVDYVSSHSAMEVLKFCSITNRNFAHSDKPTQAQTQTQQNPSKRNRQWSNKGVLGSENVIPQRFFLSTFSLMLLVCSPEPEEKSVLLVSIRSGQRKMEDSLHHITSQTQTQSTKPIAPSLQPYQFCSYSSPSLTPKVSKKSCNQIRARIIKRYFYF